MNEQDLIKAFKAFKESSFALSEAIDKYNNSHEYLMCDEEYPFSLSFDEMLFEISNWVDAQTEILTARGE